MLSVLAKLALVLTTIAPIGFTFAFLLLTQSQYSLAAIAFFSSILLSAFCMKIIEVSKDRLNVTKITALNFKPADKEISGYFVAYMLPIIGAGESFLSPSTAIFFIIVFFIFIWASKSFYSNPILALFGYKFYEVQASSGACYLLITTKKIKNKEGIKSVSFLTEYTLVEIQED